MYFGKVLFGSLLLLLVDNPFCIVTTASPLTCHGVNVLFPENMKAAIRKCLNDQGVTTTPKDLPAEKKACYTKCIFAQEGFIDENGKPHKDKVQEIVKNGFPEEVQASFIAGVGKCIDDFGSQVDPAEENCSSYKPVGDCVNKNYVVHCHR